MSLSPGKKLLRFAPQKVKLPACYRFSLAGHPQRRTGGFTTHYHRAARELITAAWNN
jgi:hypothetical protein